MMYAYTTGAAVDHVGPLPRTARRQDTGEWVTPPPDGWTDELAAACGWLPVVESPRPTDTDTDTHEPTYTRDGDTVVQTWTPRPWTLVELFAPAMLTDLSARVARIEAHLWPADPEPTATTTGQTIDALGGVWPQGAILAEGGKLWRNTAGVPLTTPPSGFPGTPSQWTRLFVEVTKPDKPAEPELPTVAAWSATTTYSVGDRCTVGGRTYQCMVAHGAEYQGTWAPPNASVWTDVGPA